MCAVRSEGSLDCFHVFSEVASIAALTIVFVDILCVGQNMVVSDDGSSPWDPMV
jgi:hypothetical protein